MGWLTLDDKMILGLIAEGIDTGQAASTLAIKTGRLYCPFLLGNSTLGNATQISTGIIRAIPFRITRPAKLDLLSVFLLSGGVNGSTKFRMAIYKSDPVSLAPAGLHVQTLEITQTATNAEYALSAMNVLLEPGVYYWAITNNASAGKAQTFRGFSSATQEIVLHYLNGSQSSAISRVEAAFTYSASGFPAQFPSTFSYLNGVSFNPESLLLKLSAV